MGVKNKKKYVRLLVLLVIALILTDYYYFDKFLNKTLIEKEIVIVKRVIDGDTIELESGERVRLLGINTPEKGEWLYEEAKKFLNNSIFSLNSIPHLSLSRVIVSVKLTSLVLP